MTKVKLTRRGRIVVAILVLLLAVGTWKMLDHGYRECIARGYDPGVCSIE